MADLGEMRVKVGADISGLLSKVDAAKAKLGQLVESQQGLKEKINDVNTSLRLNEKELTAANVKLQALNTSSKEGKTAAAALRTEIAQLAKNSALLNTELTTAKGTLATTTAEIKVQTVAVKQAENAHTGFAAGAGKVYGGLRKLAYLLPGIGISGLVALISGPVIDAFKEWINAVDELSAKAKLFQAINKDASKGASEQVSSLEVLRQKLTDMTKPMSTRLQLAKDYNKIADEGNKINLAEINNLTEINKQIDKQIGLIERQSLAKAAQSKIAGFADKAIDAEFAFQDALRKSGLTEEQVAQSIDARMKQTDAAIKKTQQSLDGFNPNKNVIVKPLVPDAKSALDQVQLVDKKLEALLLAKKSAAFQLQDVIKTLLPDISDDSFTKKDTTKNTDKTKKDIEIIADILQKLGIQIDFLNQKELLLKTSQAQAKISAIESAINTLMQKFKLQANDPIIIKLEAQVQDINLTEQFKKVLKGDKNEKLAAPIDLKPEIKPDYQAFDSDLDNMIRYLKNLGVTKTDKVDLGFGVLMSEDLDTASKTKVQATFDRILAAEQKFSDSFKNTMTSTINDAFSGFGEAIGTAVGSGGDLGQAIFGSLFQVLADGIEKLGEAMITLGTAKMVVEKFSFAPGAGTILAGVATVALGAALKAAIPKFAVGGLINGPGTGTSDSVLARVSAGEFIIKADTVSKFGVGFFDKLNKGMMPKFDSFGLPKFAAGGFVTPNLVRASQVPTLSGISIGNGREVFIADTKLRGQDIVTSFKRASATISRNS